MNTLIAKIREHQKLLINQHPPAKDVKPLATESQEDISKFKELYDQFMVEVADVSRSIESDGFHPSVLGTAFGKCSRYGVYLLRGERKASINDARTLRIFGLGNDIHNQVQSTLHGMVQAGHIKSFVDEVPIEATDPPIKGHGDGILTLWNDRKILIEIKSANDEVFSNRRKWKKAKPEHFDQANIYAFILGIDIIWVIYYNKNNCEFEIFEQPIDNKKAEKQILKWRKVYGVYERGELPVRPYKQTSKSCVFCPMKERCWSDTDEGIKI